MWALKNADDSNDDGDDGKQAENLDQKQPSFMHSLWQKDKQLVIIYNKWPRTRIRCQLNQIRFIRNGRFEFK